MGIPGPTELLIVLAIVVILFGTSKLKGVGKTLGTILHDLRHITDDEEEKSYGQEEEKE